MTTLASFAPLVERFFTRGLKQRPAVVGCQFVEKIQGRFGKHRAFKLFADPLFPTLAKTATPWVIS